MRFHHLLTLTATVAIFALPTTSSAGVPQTMAYQAVLHSGGTPVTTPVQVTFTIYDAASLGSAVWTETRTVTPDSEGLVNVLLGEVTPLSESVFDGSDRWLGVQVESDPEMSPLSPIPSTSYAFKVGSIDGAKGGTLQGGLVLEEVATKAESDITEPIIIVTNLVGDSTIIEPTHVRMKELSSENQIEFSTDPGTGPLLGIRVDGTEHAVHRATASTYYQNAAKSPQAFGKKMEVGRDGLFLYGASETDTLISAVEAASGLPEIVLTDRTTTKDFAAVANQRLRIGGVSASGDVLFALEDNAGNVLVETFLDGSGEVRQIFYDPPSAKSAMAQGSKRMELSREGTVVYDGGGNIRVDLGVDNSGFGEINFYEGVAKSVAAATNKVSLNRDGLTLYGASETDTILYVRNDGDIQGRGNLAMGDNDGISTNTAYILGDLNSVTADSAVALGVRNSVTKFGASCLGGAGNSATRDYAAIVGGEDNSANGIRAFLGGGLSNTADGDHAVTGGGESNTCNARWGATVSGLSNTNAGDYSFIGAGSLNSAFDNYTAIAGGRSNRTFGEYASVPGGRNNDARGDFSFAAGRRAKADSAGSFVWADSTDADFACERTNQFRVRANGGARFDDGTQWVDLRDDGTDLITTSSGAHLTLGGTWTNSSDKNLKENITTVESRQLLEKIAALPIHEWNYKSEHDNVRHIGPMAQDFYTAFGLGTDDKSISTIDPAGIALAAIQELHKCNERLVVQNRQLNLEMKELRKMVESLMADK